MAGLLSGSCPLAWLAVSSPPYSACCWTRNVCPPTVQIRQKWLSITTSHAALHICQARNAGVKMHLHTFRLVKQDPTAKATRLGMCKLMWACMLVQPSEASPGSGNLSSFRSRDFRSKLETVKSQEISELPSSDPAILVWPVSYLNTSMQPARPAWKALPRIFHVWCTADASPRFCKGLCQHKLEVSMRALKAACVLWRSFAD